MTIKKGQRFFRIPLTYEEKFHIKILYNLDIPLLGYCADTLMRRELQKHEPNNPKGLEQIPIERLEEFRSLIEEHEQIYFEEE